MAIRLDSLEEFDRLALGQLDNGLLPRGSAANLATHAALLPLLPHGSNCGDANIEEFLDRPLDIVLGCPHIHRKSGEILSFPTDGALLGDKGSAEDLKDVQGRIRDQIKLCQEEIGLGGRWGSKPVPGREAPDLESSPDVDKKTLKDLHEMFTGTGVSEPDLAAVAPPPEAEPASQEAATTECFGSEGDDSDSDAYLAAIASPKETATPLQNIDQLLNDLDL